MRAAVELLFCTSSAASAKVNNVGVPTRKRGARSNKYENGRLFFSPSLCDGRVTGYPLDKYVDSGSILEKEKKGKKRGVHPWQRRIVSMTNALISLPSNDIIIIRLKRGGGEYVTRAASMVVVVVPVGLGRG